VEDFSGEHHNANRWIVTAYIENSGGQCDFGRPVRQVPETLHEKYLDFLDGQGSLVTTQDGQGQLVHQGSRCFSHTSGSVTTRGKDGLERQGRCRLPALRASRAA
jgi:hypothetical protein